MTRASDRRLWPVALAAVVCLGGLARQARADWLAGWNYRQEITVDPSAAPVDLAGFPLLVKVADPASGVFTHSASPGGLDIAFTTADGVSVVPHELERFAPGGSPALDAWVKTDVSGSAPTTLYVYYGNADGVDRQQGAATWDANYRMVQHLQEDPGGAAPQMLDSTAYANHGTAGGALGAASQVAGKVDGSVWFVESSLDHIACGSDASLKLTGAFTLEAWVQIAELDGWLHNIVGFSDSEQRGYKLAWDNRFGNQIWFCANDARQPYVYNTLRPYVSLQPGQWAHVAATYEPTRMEVFVNGLSVGSRAPTSAPGAYDGSQVYIGRWGSFWFDGGIDEVRISDVVRSSEWLLTSYRMMNSPGDYVSLGAEQIPEPASMLVLASGLAGLAARRRRRRP